MADPGWHYEEYRNHVLIVSLFFILLGTVPHSIIIFESWKRKKTDMWPLIMRLYSIACVLNITLGGLVCNRHELIDGYMIFLSYGLIGKLRIGLLNSILNFLPTLLVVFSPIMITTIMAMRYFIIRSGTPCNLKIVIATFTAAALISSPLSVMSAMNYVDISDISTTNLTESLRRETEVISAYAVKTNYLMILVRNIGDTASGFCIVLGVIFSYLNYRNMQSHIKLINHLKSDNHYLLYKVIGLELIVMFFYFLASIAHFFFNSVIPPSIAVYVNLFNYANFALPATLQGCLTIYILPSYRAKFRSFMILFKTAAVSPEVATCEAPKNEIAFLDPVLVHVTYVARMANHATVTIR